jgi:hypothetical protein
LSANRFHSSKSYHFDGLRTLEFTVRLLVAPLVDERRQSQSILKKNDPAIATTEESRINPDICNAMPEGEQPCMPRKLMETSLDEIIPTMTHIRIIARMQFLEMVWIEGFFI